MHVEMHLSEDVDADKLPYFADDMQKFVVKYRLRGEITIFLGEK